MSIKFNFETFQKKQKTERKIVNIGSSGNMATSVNTFDFLPKTLAGGWLFG